MGVAARSNGPALVVDSVRAGSGGSSVELEFWAPMERSEEEEEEGVRWRLWLGFSPKSYIYRRG